MKCKTIQVVWHSKEPVLSVDFHSSGTLATAGGDKDVKFWQVYQDEDGTPAVRFLYSLNGHSKSVNCVRFSPKGSLLCSAGDDGEVLLWRQTQQPVKNTLSPESDGALWKMYGALRGHREDVQDVCWSPDSTAVLSGSIDNQCMVFDVNQKKAVCRLENHHHYVQGVAWDPLSRYVVTQSADRTCKVYAPKPPPAGKKSTTTTSAAVSCKDLVCQYTLCKRTFSGGPPGTPASIQPAADGAHEGGSTKAKPKKHYLFLDESMNTFFRRLSWSPEGSFLVVPAGVYKKEEAASPCNTTYVYNRGDWSTPLLHLPSLGKPVVAVRFNPNLYELRGTAIPTSTAYKLPYRVIFAVATPDSVLIYDTQSLHPLILLGALHCVNITDIAWSADGNTLAVSSLDGYCSIAAFEPGELGRIMDNGLLPHKVAECISKSLNSSEEEAAALGVPEVCPEAEPQCAIKEDEEQDDKRPELIARASHSPTPEQGGRSQTVRRIQPQPVGMPTPLVTPQPAVAGPSSRAYSPSPVGHPSQPPPPVSAVKRRLTPVPVSPNRETTPSQASPQAALTVPSSDEAGHSGTPKAPRRILPQAVVTTSQDPTTSTSHEGPIAAARDLAVVQESNLNAEDKDDRGATGWGRGTSIAMMAMQAGCQAAEIKVIKEEVQHKEQEPQPKRRRRITPEPMSPSHLSQ